MVKKIQLIIIHRNSENHNNKGALLNFALTNEPLYKIIFDKLQTNSFSQNYDTVLALPDDWQISDHYRQNNLTYDNKILYDFHKTNNHKNLWCIISNGHFVTNFDHSKLNSLLTNNNDGIITIDVTSDLLAYREKLQVTSDHNLAGFRRLYSDSILPMSLPTDWPAHIFIKFDHLNKIFKNGIPLDFSEFKNLCKINLLGVSSFQIAGKILDLQKENHLLYFLTTKINFFGSQFINADNQKNYSDFKKVFPNVKIFGQVLIGNNVRLNENVTLIGPTIICDNVTIGRSSVIKSSIIAPGGLIPRENIIQNRLITNAHSIEKENELNCKDQKSFSYDIESHSDLRYKIWHKLSYVRTIKRIVDISISLIVLILFAPFFPIIGLFIKLNSKGPVFFKHKRQGLYGKEFDCFKFRTMIIGADDIQAKLRSKNQVDGPQFKVEDDPRVTVVGRFLRNTFIDEIPQFINVLCGHMSLVGPRPSPRKENSTCPFWRDARLSVRPGITGLWQIARTRLPGRDFQEWIYYDTQYVRDISMMLDLKICFQTAKKLIKEFVKQF